MTRLRLFLLLAVIPLHGLSGQRLSAREGTYVEVGLGAARLAERICGSCTGSNRSIGPALLLRIGQRVAPAFELAGEVQATLSGGRHFEAVLLTGTLVAPPEYAPWLRLGGGVLLHPGVGDDVTASARGGEQHGVDVGMGIVIGIGLDIPLRGNRSLSPQASYIHQIGSERRFSLVMIGAGLRLFWWVTAFLNPAGAGVFLKVAASADQEGDPMNPEILKMILLNTSMVVLPWLVGGLILIAAVSFSPLGRLWVGYLRDRRRDAEALEAMLAETSALRTVLGEVVERLDATERRLALGPPTPQPRRNISDDIVRTPV